MIEQLNKIDTNITIFLNALRADWLDGFMILISEKYVWLPLYIFLIAILIRKEKLNGIVAIVLISALFGISESVPSAIFKPWIERLRPSHQPLLEGIINVPHNKGGTYGFFSAHASNTFMLASFFFFLYIKEINWIFTLLVWSLIVSYSRIYLGVHYFGDVLTGIIFGGIVGWTGAKIYTKLKKINLLSKAS